MLLIAVLASIQATQSSALGSPQHSATPFLEQLAARDASIVSLMLPFKAEYTAEPGCDYVQQGVWIADGGRRAAVALSGCRAGQAELVWECWDGSRNRMATGTSSWEVLDGQSPPTPDAFSGLVMTRRPYNDLLASATLPNHLAGFPVNMKWSEYLKQMSDLAILDERRVGDRLVVPLLFDMDGGKQDGSYQFPWIVEFDKSRLVVLRVQNFVPNEKDKHGPPVQGSEIPNQLSASNWTRNMHLEVLAVHELIRSVWIGSEARLTVSHHFSALPKAKIVIDVSKARCNAEIPSTWLDVKARPGVKERVLGSDGRESK